MSKNITTVKVGDGREILLSYGVPVAAFLPGVGFVKTVKKYSVTTSKHVNQYAGRDAQAVPDAEFRSLIAF